MNELDFAASLNGEFRGAQDAGWSTTLTADQVFDELVERLESPAPHSLADLRIILMLYSQLAEAGGVYETLKNMMRLIQREPHNLWPFQDLVRVRSMPNRVIGPNANATFRDLASHARRIGLIRLSQAFETVFRDDIRNGISHADYILWSDGLRLRRRNGGAVIRLSFEELSSAIGIGVAFYQTLRHLRTEAVRGYNPSKEITGRFSANPPMPHTVEYDPENGSFSISSSSAGSMVTDEYLRQESINKYLSGHVFSTFIQSDQSRECAVDFLAYGIEPAEVALSADQFAALLTEIEQEGLWDEQFENGSTDGLLALSPRGFTRINSQQDVEAFIGTPEFELIFEGPETPNH